MRLKLLNKLNPYYNRQLEILSGFASSMRPKAYSSVLGGIKNAKERIGSARKMGWRFIFAATLIFLIFAGKAPFEFLRNTIRAISGSTQTINLYANYAQPDKKSDAYDQGWWQGEKMIGAPDLGPKAGIRDFSDLNSAFYAGGSYSMVLGNFRWLEADIKKETLPIDAASQSGESMEPAGSIKADEADKQTGLIDPQSETEGTGQAGTDGAVTPAGNDQSGEDPVNADTAGDNKGTGLIQPADSAEVGGGAAEVVPGDGPSSDAVKVEEPDSDRIKESPVEIMSEEDAANLDKASSDEVKQEDTEKAPDVSFLEKALDRISAPFARAEEYLTQEIKNLTDLGEFKGAKLKLSIALSDGQIHKGDSPDLPVSANPGGEKLSNEEANPARDDIANPETVSGTALEGTDAETPVSGEASDIESATDAKQSSIDSAGSSENIEPIDDSADGKPVEVIENPDASSQSSAVPDNVPATNQETGTDSGTGDTSFLDLLAEKADAQNGQARIVIWYSLGETSGASSTDIIWKKLDTLSGAELSNALNGGYYSFNLDFIKSWDELQKLQVKLEGVAEDGAKLMAYLDSAWIEASFDSNDQLKILEKRARWQSALDLLSKKLVFNPADGGTLEFRYNKNETRIWDTLGEIMGLSSFWKNVEIEAKLVDSDRKVSNVPLTMMFEEDGGFSIKLPDGMRDLKPGKYSLLFHIVDRSGSEEEIFDLSQEFSWGVLVFNTDKSAYMPDEEAYFQFAVLDENGGTICNAGLEVSVKDPSGKIDELTTETEEYFSRILRSETCGPQTVSDEPDYSAHYKFGETGDYLVTIRAITDSGTKEISETVKVVNSLDFEVKRQGASRIYPKADYAMSMSIISKRDFKGDISETVPGDFRIISSETRIDRGDKSGFRKVQYYYEEINDGSGKKLLWHDVELKAGEKLAIDYAYDAPDRSPEIFLLGPLKLYQADGTYFEEYRRWQIASDSFRKRAKTVQFLGGIYNGGTASGQNTNTDYNFSSFTFRLAETGVKIKNAFIIFETQFEAYDQVGGDYTGYRLAFDSCPTGSCSIDPFNGTGRVLEDNSSILAYDESESNQGRILADVTSEAQLAAYTGAGQELTAQIGYQIKNGTSKTALANAKAVLVVTYTYDYDTVNQTNTVTYPLDSTNGTDSGSRQASIVGPCLLNSSCPKFNYTMDIPEWPGVATSSNRVGVWFKMFNVTDGAVATDMNTNLNIEYGGQTSNPVSDTFHHEAFNGGTQGNAPAMYFPDWPGSGYLENAAETVENYVDINTNYLMGGEVTETYVASTSAPVKTRTVSFPIGVVNDGGINTLTSRSVNVYFPENGAATGTVKIKSAWFRIISNNYNSANYTLTVSSKVGSRAVSGNSAYLSNAAGTVVMPSFNIVHIISSSSDLAELENANAQTPKTVTLNTTSSNTVFGGVSAELMVTYTYSSEGEGYLDSLQLFGGQSSSNPATSTVINSAVSSVFPETGKKTIIGGALLASYLNSDSLLAVTSDNIYLGANLSTTTVSCPVSHISHTDAVNTFTEYYKEVTAALDTTDNQAYNACYADDDTLVTTDGARMNGILTYTYKWENTAPTGTFGVLQEKNNGSQSVDLSLWAGDADGDSSRVKVEFATGTTCNFSISGKPTLDENPSNVSATFGLPAISNAAAYQIGTVNSYIKTASGTNLVNFDWLAGGDLGSVEGTYCLRMTANDLGTDQLIPATSTVYVDTRAPVAPGALSLRSRIGTALTLNFGATSTETNFREYKIFYKIANGADPTEADSVFASTSDISLSNKLFNGKATTTIGGLTASTTYSFAVWAYDTYGNKSSSTRVDITTNDAPTGIFNSVLEKNDSSGRVDISIKVNDLNRQDYLKAKLEYVLGSACDFSPGAKPTLDIDQANIQASWGPLTLDNAPEFQIGQPGAWIKTSPGENNIDFDWLSRMEESAADGIYCLRLTVNDTFDNQLQSATTTFTLDNVKPTAPGSLLAGAISADNLTLIFATTTPSSDTNPPPANAYKIYYRQGVSGVTEGDMEIDAASLDAYGYSGATSTKKNGLSPDTWYVFNIWSYDKYGNKSSSTETAIKTNATVNNVSLSFIDPTTVGPDTDIAIAGTAEWTFRAIVNEINGWQTIASTTLSLADKADSISPFSDLSFYWDQTSNLFYENGADSQNAVSISPSSAANCSGLSCTLDFKLVFSKTFASTSINYTAELRSVNDSGMVDDDQYGNFYQVRFPFVTQTHYRFRNDDGAE